MMSEIEIARRLDDLDRKLDAEFTKLDAEFAKINVQLDQTVTKSDVNAAVLQGMGVVIGVVVGTVVVLSALGVLNV